MKRKKGDGKKGRYHFLPISYESKKVVEIRKYPLAEADTLNQTV
jgi:hypothetical protein